jgi:excisionase family DNA binding protein
MSPKSPSETALYVKLPAAAVEKLDRASAALGVSKKQLVTQMVEKYDPPQKLVTGWHSFSAYDLPEVMNAEQAAEFLQVSPQTVLEMAEAGTLPGKKLGSHWRFSREALVAWLSG